MRSSIKSRYQQKTI